MFQPPPSWRGHIHFELVFNKRFFPSSNYISQSFAIGTVMIDGSLCSERVAHSCFVSADYNMKLQQIAIFERKTALPACPGKRATCLFSPLWNIFSQP
jgi:hypothetical protein